MTNDHDISYLDQLAVCRKLNVDMIRLSDQRKYPAARLQFVNVHDSRRDRKLLGTFVSEH